MNINLQPMKLVLAIVLSSTSLLASFTLIGTQASSTQLPSQEPIRVNLPQLPPGPAPGGRRFGGARRGSCPDVKPPLTALVPLTEQPASVTNVWGLTTEEHPKLWFYLPYNKSAGYAAEFILLDDESKDSVYNTAIALPEQAGVIGVSIPQRVPPLQVGKRYRWFLNVYCNPQKQSAPIYVEGVILRKEPNQNVANQLQKAQPLQQVAIYANNAFWYDALTTLAEMRQKNPQNPTLQTKWTDLLAAVGLDELATKPLISQE
ncbi:MAG: DUF928 domain-containing protein [Fischerella sp.]|nr:DUF928 domain-containing protein [Fischerella sp.]